MGSSSSKFARAGASAAKRQYPKTPSNTTTPASPKPPSSNAPPPPPPASSPGPTVHSQTSPQTSKNEAIDLDARDPSFSSRLSRLGPVSTDPSTYSPPSSSTHHQSLSSSTNAPIFPSDPSASRSGGDNTMLKIVRARELAGERANMESEEMGRRGFEGRTLVDGVTLRRAVGMLSQGMGAEAVEKELRLAGGVVEKLGVRKGDTGVLGIQG
ncbi:MAG: hypothetical protein Q9227_004160 [Pyrenula ochraceoflavens]